MQSKFFREIDDEDDEELEYFYGKSISTSAGGRKRKFKQYFRWEVIKDKWGEIEIKDKQTGEQMKFKDVIILPNKVFEWDWNWDQKNKMKHNPGIRTADIQYLIQHQINKCDDIEFFILTTGRENQLLISQEIQDYIINIMKIKPENLFVISTQEALMKFSELSQNSNKIALMCHSTC